MKQNTPYVKRFENGILINPITKENPYLFSTHSYLKPSFRMWKTVRNKYFTGKTIVK